MMHALHIPRHVGVVLQGGELPARPLVQVPLNGGLPPPPKSMTALELFQVARAMMFIVRDVPDDFWAHSGYPVSTGMQLNCIRKQKMFRGKEFRETFHTLRFYAPAAIRYGIEQLLMVDEHCHTSDEAWEALDGIYGHARFLCKLTAFLPPRGLD
jgi:hypothetical protein